MSERDEPEQGEDLRRAAQDVMSATWSRDIYLTRGWATPISGDRTTIRERFLR